MRRDFASHVLFFLLLSFFLDPAVPVLQAEVTKTIWVAHRRVDCIGVAPQKCYLIKDTQYEDWRFWYGEIAGFAFEEGYAYEIRVVERQIENPPADASAIELELVEVIIKVDTGEGIRPAAPQPPPVQAAPPAPAPPPPVPPPPAAPTPVERLETPPEIDSSPPPKAAPTQPAPPPAPSEAAQYRGHLTIGTGIETRSFKICGAEESIWIEDRSDNDLWHTYRQLTAVPNRPLYMVVRGRLTEPPPSGFGAHYSQQLLVEEFRHAALESAGCFDDVGRFAFKVSGNEPSWHLEISRRGLVFSELGVEGKTLFPHTPPTFLDDRIVYRSQTGGNIPRTLLVNLQEKSCRDTMADAGYSFSATVEVDRRTLTGCAFRGEGEP